MTIAATAIALLALAFLPAARNAFVARARLAGAAIVGLFLVAGVATLALAMRARDDAPAADRPLRELAGGYVGSEACRACHPSQYHSWHASYHRTMTQVATPETVLAPTGGELARRGETIVAGDQPLALITGSHHMQSYWTPAGEGRSLTLLPWAYLVEERRLVPRAALFVQPPGVSSIAPAASWNRVCVKCHTTDPRGRAVEGTATDTRVAELGIACEACHGPGGDHVQANASPARRYQLHLARAADPTITLPSRLPHDRGSEVCGQCHSVWVFPSESEAARYHERGFDYRPGDELARTRRLITRATIDQTPALAATLAAQPDYADRYFWRDGMIRVTGREYNGLVESPCFLRGKLECSSCHTMHPRDEDPRPLTTWADDQLRAGGTDEACLSCHESLRGKIAAHTHHADSSTGSRCVSCHMPPTTFGLLGATRSHRISSPTVQESLDTGRPNACNGCHLDRTLAWTAERLSAWYRQPQPTLSDDQRTVAASILWALAGDAGQRALMAWSFGSPDARAASGEAWMAPFVAQLLDDSYDAVRLVAGRTLARLEAGRGVPYDFAGPAAARIDAQRALYQRSPRPAPGAARSDLLQLEDGSLDRARMTRIAEWRDERPVALWE
jgi:hypothetical protein